MSSSLQILSAKLRRILAQLPNLPRALKMIWRVAPGWTTAWALILIVQGLLPAALVYLTKLVVDGVVATQRTGGDWPSVRSALIKVALLGVVMLLMEAARV